MRATWLVLVMMAGATLAQQNPATISGSNSSRASQPAPQPPPTQPVTAPQPGTTTTGAAQPMATPGGQQQQSTGAGGTQPLPGGAVIIGGYGSTLVQTDGGGDTSTLSGPGPNVSTGPTVGSGPEIGVTEVGADAGAR